jgi:hypothetical protein
MVLGSWKERKAAVRVPEVLEGVALKLFIIFLLLSARIDQVCSVGEIVRDSREKGPGADEEGEAERPSNSYLLSDGEAPQGRQVRLRSR